MTCPRSQSQEAMEKGCTPRSSSAQDHDCSGLQTRVGCQRYQGPRAHFAHCTDRKAEAQKEQGPEGELGAASRGQSPSPSQQGQQWPGGAVGPAHPHFSLRSSPPVVARVGVGYMLLFLFFCIGPFLIVVLCGVRLKLMVGCAHSWLLSVLLGGSGRLGQKPFRAPQPQGG